MKQKKISKRILALVLSVVMTMTSIPFIVAEAAGAYDPRPYFVKTEGGKKVALDNPPASAYVNEKGGITVVFPEAMPNTEYRKHKEIQGFFIRVFDLGLKSELHQQKEIANKFVTLLEVDQAAHLDDAGNISSFSVDFTKKELADSIQKVGTYGSRTLDSDIFDPAHRYDVGIVAVDSDNWFSNEVHTILSNVPEFIYNPEVYSPLKDDAHAMREMMTFEKEIGGREQKLSGSKLEFGSYDGQVGVETPDKTSSNPKDSAGVRLRITNVQTPGAPETQSFETTFSRQTWDFKGANEVWFWLDFSQVDIKGLSFRLRTNEKMYIDEDRTNHTAEQSHFGETIYSTKGYGYYTPTSGAKEQGYVYLQQEDAGWKKVPLNNDGTLDLAHFKGYVRIPIAFMCSETDTYAKISNQDMATGETRTVEIKQPNAAKATENNESKTKIRAWLKSLLYPGQGVLVDKAGTPISEALLMQNRVHGATLLWGSKNFLNPNGYNTYTYSFINNATEIKETKTGNDISLDLSAAERYKSDNPAEWAPMIAAAVGKSPQCMQKKGEPSTDRAYIDNNNVVQNRENGIKAIEDLYAAGIAFEDWSDDSKEKALFIDNVLFYRTDGKPYSENTLNGDVNTGLPVATYFDQAKEVPRAIFNACNKYFNDPNWSDYRAVAYIEAMIAGYEKAFKDYPTVKDSLQYVKEEGLPKKRVLITDETVGLNKKAIELDMQEEWNLFKTAWALCDTAKTIQKDNNGAQDLVPDLERAIEKLPDPKNIYALNEPLQKEIERLYLIYNKLNAVQLQSLGIETEQRLITYFSYLATAKGENNVVVGQILSDRPFIPFNTFENNTTLGERALQLENYPGPIGGAGFNYKDYRYTSPFLTYSTTSFFDFAGYDDDTWKSSAAGSATSNDATKDGIKHNLLQNGAWANITNEGFQGSKGATMTVDIQSYNKGHGNYNIISFTKDSLNPHTTTDGIDPGGEKRPDNSMQKEKFGDLAMSLKGVTPPANPPLSLVMYVDFSKIKDFRFSVTISTYENEAKYEAGKRYEDYALDTGGSKLFYMLDSVTGEWKAAESGSKYTYRSNSGYNRGDGTRVTLNGYKGYIMIPLYHFKHGGNSFTGERPRKLDEEKHVLDNIWRINFGVAPDGECYPDAPENKNPSAINLDGKTFTIDNVGFSYDPVAYKNKVAARGVKDKNFDELFKAKALSSEYFEKAVAGIDPYDTQSLADGIKAADAIYGTDTTPGALNAYQKQIPSVVKAKARLEELRAIQAAPGDNALLPQPQTYKDITALKAAIDALPAEATTFGNTVGNKDLPYPGFKQVAKNVDGKPTTYAEVNYDAYGFKSLQEVQAVIDLYELNYKRFAKSAIEDPSGGLGPIDPEDAVTSYREKLFYAYNAAKRCMAIQSWIGTEDGNGLKALEKKIVALYTPNAAHPIYDHVLKDGKAKNFVSNTPESQAVMQEVYDLYENLNHFAKDLLKRGLNEPDGINGYNEAYKYIPRAVKNILNNMQTYPLVLDPLMEIPAGIPSVTQRYASLYSSLNTAINGATPTKLSPSLIAELGEYYKEYKAFLPAYYNVQELNANMGKILDLFDKHTIAVTENVISVSNTTVDGGSAFKVNYSLQFPFKDPAQKIYLAISSKNGGLQKGTEKLKYTLDFGTQTGIDPTTILLPTDAVTPYVPQTAYEVSSNTYTADAPMTTEIKVHVDDTQNLNVSGAWTDELVVTLVDALGKPILEKKSIDANTGVVTWGDPIQQTIAINFSGADSFVVSIPASVEIPQNSTQTVVKNIVIQHNMQSTKQITVELDPSNQYKMTLDETALPNGVVAPVGAASIPYQAVSSTTGQSYVGTGASVSQNETLSVNVKSEDWKKAYINKYKDEAMTFIIEYKDVAAP